jgi:hypothetical protein
MRNERCGEGKREGQTQILTTDYRDVMEDNGVERLLDVDDDTPTTGVGAGADRATATDTDDDVAS